MSVKHEPEGVAVLVSIDDIGPLYGRVIHDEVELFHLDPDGPFENVRPGPRSWRVEIPEIPHRLIGPLREHIERLDRPAVVRMWGAVVRECYVGKAYGLFNSLHPYSSTRSPSIGLTLRATGPLERERPSL